MRLRLGIHTLGLEFSENDWPNSPWIREIDCSNHGACVVQNGKPVCFCYQGKGNFRFGLDFLSTQNLNNPW